MQGREKSSLKLRERATQRKPQKRLEKAHRKVLATIPEAKEKKKTSPNNDEVPVTVKGKKISKKMESGEGSGKAREAKNDTNTEDLEVKQYASLESSAYGERKRSAATTHKTSRYTPLKAKPEVLRYR